MVSVPQRVATRLNLIVAAVCAAIILGVWLTTLQRIHSERRQAVAAAISSNSNLAIAFEQHMYRTLKAAEQVAAFVRDEYLQQGRINLRQWVEQGIIRETMFTIISVVDEQGDLVDSSHAAAQANYADRPFFLAQRDAVDDILFINAPVIGRVSREVRVPMSLRITLPDGRFGGVVVLSVEPENFTDFYNQADLGARGLLELTGLDAVVRSRKIGKQGSQGQDAARLPWFDRLSISAEDSFIDDGSALDGVARVVSYRRLEGYPLMVAVGTSYTDELAPVFQRRNDYLVAAGLSSLALLVFAGLLLVLLRRQRLAAEALQASEALYRATFYQAATGIVHVTPEGRIIEANQKFHDMLGYGAGELADHMLAELSDPEYQNEARRFIQDTVAARYRRGASSGLEKPYRRKDGSLLWVHEALGAVRDAQGRASYLVAVTQDITARKALEERLSHDAMHDVLTGLPNRNMFYDRLNQALSSARRHQRLMAVLYLDLDGFKEVNDNYGHGMGDLLLQHVGRRLEHSMRAEDTAARFGGDEFAIVLANISAEADHERVAEKLIAVLSEPYEIEGRTIIISASVGAAVFPTHGDDPKALILYADTAMYKAKRAKRSGQA